jgi:hypothetical protein
MHLLGFKGEMDRARADLWGRVYLETVKRPDIAARSYTPEGRPERAPSAIGGL